MIQVIVNGSPHRLDQPLDVAALIQRLDFDLPGTRGYEIVSYRIGESSPLIGLKSRELPISDVSRIVCIARRGRIIQIGSVVGSSGNAGQTNYAAAKAALVGFTKSLALEVGSRDITVNCVAPGFVDTEMTQALAQAQREALIARIPLGRLGTPDDVANAVLFLAGPRAGYITGATLHVNGGMLMP